MITYDVEGLYKNIKDYIGIEGKKTKFEIIQIYIIIYNLYATINMLIETCAKIWSTLSNLVRKCEIPQNFKIIFKPLLCDPELFHKLNFWCETASKYWQCCFVSIMYSN